MNKQSKKNFSLAVVGGGASGLMAAITAAREAVRQQNRIKVTIYESNARVGKKILVTGNGRCNFSNENIAKENFHGDAELAYRIYTQFDNRATVDFFRSLGLYSKSDFAGRLYPMSSQASAVLDVLRFEAEKLGIEIVSETKITEIKILHGSFLLNNRFWADRCIIATGGKAAFVHGSDGSGFDLVKKLGVSLTPLFPALTPLVCENFGKNLKGIRAQGSVSIRCSGNILASDSGEIQYTEYGLSGIPSMQVSGAAAKAMYFEKADVFAVVDSCPVFSKEELKDIISDIVERNPESPGEMLLAGLMPKKLGAQLISDCCVNPSKPIGRLHPSVIDKIVMCVKNKKYKISSVKGFGDAQVTTGGICGKEIDYESLELKRVKGIYVCGEIIDVDGDCGGYNLQWAWSSGYVAGKNAAEEILRCSE